MLLLGHTKFSAFKKYSNNDIVSEKNIFFPLLGGEVGGPDPKVKKFSYWSFQLIYHPLVRILSHEHLLN